jgi:hypothetical protein
MFISGWSTLIEHGPDRRNRDRVAMRARPAISFSLKSPSVNIIPNGSDERNRKPIPSKSNLDDSVSSASFHVISVTTQVFYHIQFLPQLL